jgi:hypothetical protein
MGNKGVHLIGETLPDKQQLPTLAIIKVELENQELLGHEHQMLDSVQSTCPIDWTTLQGESYSQRQV